MFIENLDLLIVGGGPSGSMSAHWAAQSNLRCSIIDKENFPREKVCGDAIPPLSYKLMLEVGLDLLKQDFIDVTEVKDLELNTEGENFIATLEGQNMFNIPRKEFDNYLWKTISSKVEKYEGYRVVGIEYSKRYKKYLTDTVSDSGERIRFCSSYIIGADGANSWVRKRSGIFPDFEMHYKKARRLYLHDPSMPLSKLNVDYPSEEKLSYIWSFSLPGNIVNTGVYSSDNDREAKRLFEMDLESKEPNLSIRVDRDSYKGYPIPTFAESEKIFSRNGVFLVGDAAGFSDPIFGHGIDIGMLSGKMAVLSILKGKRSLFFKRGRASKYYNNYVINNVSLRFEEMWKFISKTKLYKAEDIIRVTSSSWFNEPPSKL